MKRILFFTAFLALALSSFALDLPNRSVFIEGTSTLPGHRLFFIQNFTMEAGALGFRVVENKAEAGYIFRFEVQPYGDEFDPSIQYIILISLIANNGDVEIVNFGWSYSDLNEMYEYNQFLFFKAAALIPFISDEELLLLHRAYAASERPADIQAEIPVEAPVTTVTTTTTAVSSVLPNRDWQNKMLYLRTSLDYSIVFYQLQPTGLVDGQSAIADDIKNPNYIMPLDNIHWPSPGVTVGLEFQFLKFMSLEVNFQASLGDTSTYDYYNMAAGAELKYLLKLNNFMLQPYAAFLYPLNVSEVFSEFPEFSFGGGIQIAVRASCSGAFFININYMTHLSEAIKKNRYSPLFPDPAEIYYKRFVFGLGIGYKHGFINR